MRARLGQLRSRRALWVLGLAAALVALASPAAQADVWANIGPASGLGGLQGRYPLGHYALDEHFTAVEAGVFSGVDVSGLLPMIAYFFANLAWQGTAWLANILIELFAFAFSLDLVTGSGATNGAGALEPVSRAISSIYATVFGGPWMVLAVSVAGLWAMWKALVQRRYSETAGQLALSLIYVTVALLFVWQPAQTIGVASKWTNAVSGAFLSIAKNGEPASQREAKQAGADQLFGLLVAEPWAVLQFGGLQHCVKSGSGSGDSDPTSVPVQPLPARAARGLEAGEEVSAGGKTCVNNLRKYGDHFLRFASGSEERDDEYEALRDGDVSKLPDADPSKERGDYRLSAVDKPATAAMEKEGQYQRLLVAVVIFVAQLGAFCLLGALSIGVILAQVLLLLVLAFSPVALVAAAIPGRGHQFFKAWLSKLGTYLLRKVAYSLVLAILLAVCAAISAATSQLGWLMSFGLQCAFFWAVFLQRRSLTDGLIGVVTGPGSPVSDRALSVLALYHGSRSVTHSATGPARGVGRGAGRGIGWARRRLFGGGGAEKREPAPPRGSTGRPRGEARQREEVDRTEAGEARAEGKADRHQPERDGVPRADRDKAGGEARPPDLREPARKGDGGAKVESSRSGRSGKGQGTGARPVRDREPRAVGEEAQPQAAKSKGRKGAPPTAPGKAPVATPGAEPANLGEELRADRERRIEGGREDRPEQSSPPRPSRPRKGERPDEGGGER